MNPQPEPYVGNLVALLLFGLFIFYCIKSYNQSGEESKINDLFTLGYLEDQPVQVINVHQNNGLDIQLYNDCIDSLHALGMKKSEAKKKTKFIFSNYSPAPKTVQEFLMIALKI